MNDIEEKVMQLAILNGYDYIHYAGEWKGYDVYEPIFWDSKPLCVGLPMYILVNESDIRITDEKECFEVMHELESGFEDSRYIENEPLEIESNLTIKSFTFVRGGYPYAPEIYKYKSTKKHGKILEYNNREFERIGLIDIPIEDKFISIKPTLKISITDENFDEYALGMIKYFHEDFGVNPNVHDGEWYEFKATLSNGQKLKSQGYNYFPENYGKFIAYLEYYLK